MSSPAPAAIQRPFVPTHYRRRDGFRAMLLADRDGTALYRVQVAAGRHTVDRVVSATSGHFTRTFGAR